MDVLGDGGENVRDESVEFIEASPRPTAQETDKNASHTRGIERFVAVKDENIATERVAKCLDRFGFARSRRAVRISTKSKGHGLGQYQKTFLRQCRLDKAPIDAEEFPRVVKDATQHMHTNVVSLIRRLEM